MDTANAIIHDAATFATSTSLALTASVQTADPKTRTLERFSWAHI